MTTAADLTALMDELHVKCGVPYPPEQSCRQQVLDALEELGAGAFPIGRFVRVEFAGREFQLEVFSEAAATWVVKGVAGWCLKGHANDGRSAWAAAIEAANVMAKAKAMIDDFKPVTA